MTERESFKLQELKQKKFFIQGGQCAVCGKMLLDGTPQLAHRIPQSEMFLQKYGEAVIHHEKNLVLVCSGKCNDSVLIQNNPVEIQRLIDEIEGEIL